MLLSLSLAMMLSAAQAEAAATAQAADAPDIVVNGQRLKRIRIDTKRDRKTGRQRCVVRRSSGDHGLDAAFCDAVLACASTARKVAEMEACLAPRMAEIARRPA